ncbi:DUF2884 family protein [Rheinheimera sp. A13L]|jgi:hypothetical protein|uniref:DUF2884 family protein n=1 Tax=Rheinheimera sp. A13L TaxID=506534 RepID=UPI00031512C7|nr:DUF2884 family protein [Rheinheimera sp. A13L]
MRVDTLRFILILLLMFCSWPGFSNECNMAFRHGILISPEQIRIQTSNRTVFQINHDQDLFIRGEWITLNPAEQELVRQYAQGLRKFVPELVSIAVDSVELGLTAIENMLAGIGNSSQQQEWQALIRETTYQLTSRFVRSGDHFYLAPQSLNELDAFLHGELKTQLKDLAKYTVGAVWDALRDALRQSEDNFERTESQNWQPADELLAKINSGLDLKADELEQKSVLFCQRLTELDQIETQLQQRVPQLLAYDVVTMK